MFFSVKVPNSSTNPVFSVEIEREFLQKMRHRCQKKSPRVQKSSRNLKILGKKVENREKWSEIAEETWIFCENYSKMLKKIANFQKTSKKGCRSTGNYHIYIIVQGTGKETGEGGMSAGGPKVLIRIYVFSTQGDFTRYFGHELCFLL